MRHWIMGLALTGLTLTTSNLWAQSEADSEKEKAAAAIKEAAQAASEAKSAARNAAEKAIEAAKQKLLENKDAGKNMELRVERVGSILKVGPDGKVEVTQLGGDVPMLNEEQREKLLKEPQKFLEELLKQAKSVEAAASAAASSSGEKGSHKVESRITVNGGTMKGRVITVGPDGKEEVREFTVDSAEEALGKGSEAIQQILKSADIPESAKKHLSLSLKSAMGGKTPSIAVLGAEKSSSQIAEKLDRVLERLEALEKKVDELKGTR